MNATKDPNEPDENENKELENNKQKEEREGFADRLVNAMAANLEKAMLMDEDERLRLERAREKRLDALLDQPLESED